MSASPRSRLSWLLFAPLLILVGVRAVAGPTPNPAVNPAESGSLQVSGTLVVQSPVTHGLVSLYPVVDTAAQSVPDGDYQLLREGLEDKTFKVEESNGGTVPTLMVRNTGTRPVLIVAGDVVQGGKQDRVITSDFVVQPDGKPVDVAVNCVEHGRWSAGNTGHSFGYGGRGEGSLKKVVQNAKDQSATWSEVASSNGRKAALVRSKGKDGEADKLEPTSGTYMASLENAAVQDEAAPSTAALIAGLQGKPGVVGVVVALGGDITTAEVFGHPGLFERSREDLVRSFVLDSVGSAASGSPPPAAEAASFLRTAMVGSVVSEKAHGEAQASELDSPDSTAFETKSKDGKRIHFNAYKK